jgi:hypothetical protein
VRWPDGFYDFVINGKSYPNALYEISPPPSMKISPVLDGQEVYVPSVLVKPLLGATATGSGASLRVAKGSKSFTVPVSHQGRLPLTVMVSKLGGRASWQHGQLVITVP